MRTPTKASQEKKTNVVDHTDHQDEQTVAFLYIGPEIENGQAILKYFKPQPAQKVEPPPEAKTGDSGDELPPPEDDGRKPPIGTQLENGLGTKPPPPTPSKDKPNGGGVGIPMLLLSLLIMVLIGFFFRREISKLILPSPTPTLEETTVTPTMPASTPTPTLDTEATQTASVLNAQALNATLTAQASLAVLPTNTPMPTDTLTPESPPTATATEGSERTFSIGSDAYIIAPDGVRLRADSNLASTEIALLITGTQVTVMDGPTPSDGLTWWKVKVVKTEQEGWVADGDATNAWLSPATPIPSP